MNIWPETPADVRAIRALIERAFKPMPYSDGAEAAIVDALRAAGDLTISLVAEEGGEIIGHVAFSPVAIDGAHDGWFGLGPVAVKPERQREGIGAALILRGLEILRERGANGCAVIGNPNIYGRVGFSSDGKLAYRELDAELVQRVVFRGAEPSGTLTYSSAFK